MLLSSLFRRLFLEALEDAFYQKRLQQKLTLCRQLLLGTRRDLLPPWLLPATRHAIFPTHRHSKPIRPLLSTP
jgi:hypothetical protein